MNNLVERTIRKYDLINFGDKIIVALSGGADSVTLFHVLYSLREKYNITIYAAHVNHNLRGDEAKRDEDFCRSLCKKYGVEIFVKSADIINLAKKRRISEELCGRNVRYSFFEELSQNLGAKIATAHTASDNAETLLFNIARGSSIGGVCAIPPKRDNIIRPLIEVTRFDIEKYCSDNNFEFVTDSTNFTDNYTRNNIRHNIIPVLKNINMSFEKSAMHLSESAREINEHLDHAAQAADEACKTEYGYSCRALLSLDIAVLKHFLAVICKKKYNIYLEQKHIYLLCEIIKNGGSLELSKNYTAVVKQGIFRIVQSSSGGFFDSMSLKENMTFSFEGKQYSVCKLSGVDDGNTVNTDLLGQNAVFRTRRPGDKFTYPKRNITKPLRKVLNELKIPSEQRDKILILAVGSTVMWCENVGVSIQGHSDRIDKALKIKITEGV